MYAALPFVTSDEITVISDQQVPIGCDINQYPFLNQETQKEFKQAYTSLGKNMKRLQKFNDTIVDMNESIDAYLYGLYQNAWCVHFDNTPTEEQWAKFKELQSLQKEAQELEAKIKEIKDKKRRESQRMLPPASLNGHNRKRVSIFSMSESQARKSSITKKPSLRAASQNHRFNRLQMSKAKRETKNVDSSFDSNISDTTGFIKHPTQHEHQSVREEQIRKRNQELIDRSIVKHKRPFR